MPTPDRQPTERTPWAELVAADDLALIDEWSRGNHDAFAVLVDRYQRLVFSVAVRIVKDASKAEEVVQIVFLDIFRDLGKFDPARGTLKVWLLQYAYSRSVTRRHHLERRQFYSRVGLDDLEPSDISTKPISRKRLILWRNRASRRRRTCATQRKAAGGHRTDLFPGFEVYRSRP